VSRRSGDLHCHGKRAKPLSCAKFRVCACELGEDVSDVPCWYPMPVRDDTGAAVIRQENMCPLPEFRLPGGQDDDFGLAAVTLAGIIDHSIRGSVKANCRQRQIT
jgi:hypothetical protein